MSFERFGNLRVPLLLSAAQQAACAASCTSACSKL
jgi:hypothetical protein